MALVINDTAVKKVVFNGNEIKTVICNGETVFNAELVLITGAAVNEPFTVRKLLTGGASTTVSGAKITFAAGRKYYGIYWEADLTDYTTLTYDIKITGISSGDTATTQVRWGAYSSLGTTSADRDSVVVPAKIVQVEKGTAGTYKGTIDLSSVTGNNYIWVYLRSHGSNGVSGTITINELKLT